eukprot:scaffold25337_cov31-Tisochrysis_lutea.AAC.1
MSEEGQSRAGRVARCQSALRLVGTHTAAALPALQGELHDCAHRRTRQPSCAHEGDAGGGGR